MGLDDRPMLESLYMWHGPVSDRGRRIPRSNAMQCNACKRVPPTASRCHPVPQSHFPPYLLHIIIAARASNHVDHRIKYSVSNDQCHCVSHEYHLRAYYHHSPHTLLSIIRTIPSNDGPRVVISHRFNSADSADTNISIPIVYQPSLVRLSLTSSDSHTPPAHRTGLVAESAEPKRCRGVCIRCSPQSPSVVHSSSRTIVLHSIQSHLAILAEFRHHFGGQETRLEPWEYFMYGTCTLVRVHMQLA